MKFVKRFAAPLLVVALCFFAVFSLLNPYFYPMHDDEQIARLYDLDQSIKSGHIPPRIVPNLGYGYGYPFFNFYPPFTYYMGEFYHLLGFSYIISTKLMLITGFILSAIFMYLLVKEFYGRLAGVVSAVSYTYVSYKAVDVYVRGAYAEFFSFVFIPLIFWAVLKVAKTNHTRYVVFGSLSTALLILSHNLIAFMSSIFIGGWVIYAWYISKNKYRFILQTLCLFLLGFGLSAYFFIPSYFEKNYTLVNILTTELADYKLHFVCAYQLWDSMWGYGGSILGCHDGISFEIGKIQLITSSLVFVMGVCLLFSRKNMKNIFPIFVFSAFLFISIFLTIKHSRFIWDVLPPLWYIQFPWRFLIFASFASSFLVGSAMFFVKGKKLRYLIAAIIIGSTILTSVYRFTPQRLIDASDAFYTNQEKIRWETSSLAYEYVPLGISTKKSKAGTTQVNITKDEIASSSSKIISGVIFYKEVKNLPHYKKFEVMAFESGVIQINTYSFPGWKIFIDGKKTEFRDDNKLKLIRVNIPEGKHTVEVKFTDTMARTVGNLLTLISIILLVVLIYYSIKKQKHET